MFIFRFLKKSNEIDVERRANKKTFRAPIIDEREEYFVAYKTNSHETPKTKARLKDKAKIIPKYVAIPFPPLNFNQTGNT